MCQLHLPEYDLFSFPQTPLWSDQCNELQPFLRLAESKG